MNRLTFDGNFCDIAKCAETDCKEGGCSQRQVWERLKAYEDTGMEPEYIPELLADAKAMLKDVRKLTQREKVYRDAIEQWGNKLQITVAIEEMSELIKELCKVFRGQVNMDNLCEEIADAAIMLEQLKIIFGVNDLVCEFMDAKVERLAQRIIRAKEAANNGETVRGTGSL